MCIQRKKSETESLGLLEQSDAVLAENRQLQADIRRVNATVDSMESTCAQLRRQHSQQLSEAEYVCFVHNHVL